MKRIPLSFNFLLALLLAFVAISCTHQKAYQKKQHQKMKHAVILEMMSKDTSAKTTARLKNFIKEGDELKRWKNHYIVYSPSGDVMAVEDSIAQVFPEMKTNLYDYLFYNFNRLYCSNVDTAKEWDNIILTANLVADTAMQQQYFNYHKTQFQQWPEVSKGFCNANFQQLIMFRKGRQLMLVISIPKGESLEELNPKTTANNPRVNDWNNMMAKYQEGIEGTKKGEVWVFFKPEMSR